MALWKRHEPRPDFVREERRWHRRALFLRRRKRRRRALALAVVVLAALAAGAWLYHALPDLLPEKDGTEPGRTVIPIPRNGGSAAHAKDRHGGFLEHAFGHAAHEQV